MIAIGKRPEAAPSRRVAQTIDRARAGTLRGESHDGDDRGRTEERPGERHPIRPLRRQAPHPKKPNDGHREGKQSVQRPGRLRMVRERQLKIVLTRERRAPDGIAKPARRREFLEKKQPDEGYRETIAPATERHDGWRLRDEADPQQDEEANPRKAIGSAEKQGASQDDESEDHHRHELSRNAEGLGRFLAPQLALRRLGGIRFRSRRFLFARFVVGRTRTAAMRASTPHARHFCFALA